MHRLLQRQIKKYLPEVLKDHTGLQALFEAIGSSYDDFEQKVKMIQHATTLSAKELFEANKELRQRADEQERVLNSLKKAFASLKARNKKLNGKSVSDNSRELAISIEEQARRIGKMNEEKDKLLKSLARQNESLNNYAHMVSHDLKSPIRNVHSLVSWVIAEEGERLESSSKENVGLIFQNLEKMDKLIDGILIHATIDNKEEKKEEIDLTRLVEKLIEEQLLPKNIEVKVKAKLPVFEVNRYRMQQLFSNLLTNAIKAVKDNKRGLIEIDFVEQEQEYRFSVSDNGIGIPEHHQVSIFDMFKKLDNDSTATGIGLALVKKIINFYHGDIWISSKETKGTTVFFTINKNV